MSKHANYKDFFLRKQLKLKQKNTFILKSLLLNEKNPKTIRFKIMLKMHKLYKDLLGVKFKNRCIFSTKIRSVSRLTNLTKSSLRDNIRWGKVTGFRKAS
jgi:ribosomal protein S14